jgi:cold shock CspA family protein
LVDNLPPNTPLPPRDAYTNPVGPPLKHFEGQQGLVTNWYAARGLGVIMTKQGEARVHWSDIPPRPRLRFLTPGEVVGFAKLEKPQLGAKTTNRPHPRPSQMFNLQAHGISFPA